MAIIYKNMAYLKIFLYEIFDRQWNSVFRCGTISIFPPGIYRTGLRFKRFGKIWGQARIHVFLLKGLCVTLWLILLRVPSRFLPHCKCLSG
jgi:hypothetical protein